MNLNLFLTDDIKLIMDSCLEEHDGLNTVRNTMRKSTPKVEHYTQVITSTASERNILICLEFESGPLGGVKNNQIFYLVP